MSRNTLFNIFVTVAFLISVTILFVIEKNEDKTLFTSSFKNYSTVIIDAGHGGEDGGAVGQDEILEKEINLAVSQKLELILNLFGVNTDMTRRDDVSLSSDGTVPLRKRKVSDIKKRVEKIVNTPNAVLISVHQNSFPQDESCHGAQVFFSKNNIESKSLAEKTQNTLKRGIDNSNNRVEKESDSSIYMLNNVNCPAILVECGFLTNDREAALLMTDAYRIKLAVCIASGFIQYQNEK